MTQVILRVHLVHLTNIGQCLPTLRPGLLTWVATITIYYYSAQKLIFILPSHEG